MIDRRELLEKARERNLGLVMIEKDYVLGWLMLGFSKIPNLVFKGGTALSKIYFPEVWRLSEDLDFSVIDAEWEDIEGVLPECLEDTSRLSGLEFRLASRFSNPGYLQLKIRYKGPIGKNWVKVDMRQNDLVDEAEERATATSYSDYPDFRLRVESLEEICASKIRSLVERRKCRDYFDLWKLLDLEFSRPRLREVLPRKMAVKNLEVPEAAALFPEGFQEILRPYWERELSRLVHPVPEIEQVLIELREKIEPLLAAPNPPTAR